MSVKRLILKFVSKKKIQLLIATNVIKRVCWNVLDFDT